MAKIPSAARMERASVQIERPIRNVRTGGEYIAQALSGAAGAVFDKQMSDRKDAYSRAELDFATALTKERSAYDQDSDWQTIESRSKASTTEALGTIASSITNPEDRKQFVESQKLKIAQNDIYLKEVAWKKKKSQARSTMDTQFADAREAALTGDMGEISGLVKQRIDSAIEQGYYTAEEGADVYRSWQNSAALGKLEMMAPADQIKALGMPWADNLSSDTKVRLQRLAEDQLRLGNAQSTVNEMMSLESDYTMEAGIQHIIETVKDPEEQEKAKALFKQARAVRDADIAAKQSKLLDDYGMEIRDNPDFNYTDIPPADREAMSEAQRTHLQALTQQKVAPRTVSSPEAVSAMTKLIKGGEWKRAEQLMIDNPSSFSDADKKSFGNSIQSQIAPHFVSYSATIKSVLDYRGVTDKKAASSLVIQLSNWREQWIGAYGKEPTSQEVQDEIAKRIAVGATDPDAIYMTGDVEIYKMDSETQEGALRRATVKDLLEKDGDGTPTFNSMTEYLNGQGVKMYELDRFEIEALFNEEQQKRALQVEYTDIYDTALESLVREPGRTKAPSNNEIFRRFMEVKRISDAS